MPLQNLTSRVLQSDFFPVFLSYLPPVIPKVGRDWFCLKTKNSCFVRFKIEASWHKGKHQGNKLLIENQRGLPDKLDAFLTQRREHEMKESQED